MDDDAAPVGLRLERLHPEDFVPLAAPRLSWRNVREGVTAAEVELLLGPDRHVARIDEARHILVEWPFAPLRSRAAGTLRVRTEHPIGWTPWSQPLAFETTLLHPADWDAVLIEPADIGRIGDPAPIFRTGFPAHADVERARLYISAHGVYEAELNGTRVGRDHLAPGWTSYPTRLRFLTYDVTGLIAREGENRLAVSVGNGWFRGRLGWSGARAFYGRSLGVIAQLEITGRDGTVRTIATGPEWTVGDGALVADDLYDGAGLDFTRAGTSGGPVTVGIDVRDRLFPATTRPVRELDRWHPVGVTAVEPGVTIVDAGQNVTGWLAIQVRGGAGRRVEVAHAEVLVDGRLETQTLRSARARDVYALDGTDRVLEPRFTFHGFRYAEIRGIALEEIEDIDVVVIGSDLERTGWFKCSDERVNRLHDNIVRSARSNLIDVPIDCPQRDERLGWTGDLQMFAPAAAFLFDVSAMLGDWLADLRADQHPDGGVPAVIPDVLSGSISPGTSATAGFSDAAVLVPLAAYRAYGDVEAIAAQWPSALKWARRALAVAGESRVRENGFQWGDWLDPSAPSGDPSRATTPADLVATAALARMLDAAREIATVVAPDLAAGLASARDDVQRAFRDRFVTADGLVVGDSVSAYVFAIRSGGLDARRRRGAAARLVRRLRDRGFVASTGFLGTAQVLDALDDADAETIATRMLLADRMPSWLAQVALGATTVWERWDSLDEDGTVNDPSMTSFNHYALGSVADWIHRRIGGLAPAAPGYATVEVDPILTSPIQHAHVRHESVRGPIELRWERHGTQAEIEISLPPDVDAVVRIEGLPPRLPSGRHRFVVNLSPAERADSFRFARRLVADVLDDAEDGPALVALLVRLGIADDTADAYHRLGPYGDVALDDIADHLAHPAFRATGPFVRRAFARSLPAMEPPGVRTY